MYQGVKEFVDGLFKETHSAISSSIAFMKYKESIVLDINNKINSSLNSGMDYTRAFEEAIKSLGDLNELVLNAPYEIVETKHEKSTLPFSRGSLIGAMWIFVPAIHFMYSIFTGQWATSWTIYLFASAATIAIASFTKHGRITKGSFIAMFWIILTAFYVLTSFALGVWAFSWIIFLLGAGFTVLVSGWKGVR